MAFNNLFENGLLPVVSKQQTTQVYPGVRGRTRKNIQVSAKDGSQITLEKGTQVLIQPLTSHKPNQAQQFNVTCYTDNTEKVDASQPESGSSINQGKTYKFTLDNDAKGVKALLKSKKPTSYFIFDEYYQESKSPLFPPGSPKLEDISQGLIPDCFMLSAIQAILNHPQGAAFIQGMMRKNEDGTVTVRLYDPGTLKPKYVTLSAAVLANQDGNVSQHKALWVHVLESAYAAMGQNTDQKVAPAVASVYSGGGTGTIAFKILTGLTTQFEVVNHQRASVWNINACFNNPDLAYLKNLLCPQVDESTNSNPQDEEANRRAEKAMRRNKDTYLAFMSATHWPILTSIYRDSGSLAPEILALRDDAADGQQGLAPYVDQEGRYANVYLAAFYHYSNYLKFYFKNQQVCDDIFASNDTESNKITKLIDLAPHDSDVAFLKQYIIYREVPVAEHLVRGNTAAFSGYYQVGQYQQFEKISQALKDGKLITACTHQKFDESVAGLRNWHIYTILGVDKKVETDDSGQTREICYIKLRNPWGGTGRVYQQKAGTFDFTALEESEAAIFKLELVDFNSYFDYIEITSAAEQRFAYNEKKQKLYSEVESALGKLTINNDSIPSLDELVAFNAQYQSYKAKFIELEFMHLNSLDAKLISSINAVFTKKEDTEHEKAEVIALLKDVTTEFYTGDEEAKHNYLFSLAKLRWLKAQEHPDLGEITQLEAKIIKASHFDSYQRLAWKKTIVDVVASGYAQSCIAKINNFNDNKTAINSEIQKIKKEELFAEKLDNLTAQLLSLKSELLLIESMNRSLKELGCSISEEEIKELSISLQQVKKELKIVQRMPVVMQKTQELKSTIVLKAEPLPDDIKGHLIEVMSTLNAQQADKFANECAHSDNPTQQELAKDILVLSRLIRLFCKLFEMLKEVASTGLAKIGFFHPRQSYARPAKPEHTISAELGSSSSDNDERDDLLPPPN